MPIYKTLEEQAKAVKNNANAIRFIKNPHPRLCLMAIMSDPLSIRHIQNQTPALCELATANHHEAFKYCQYQTFPMIKEAIARNIKNASEIKDFEQLDKEMIDTLIDIDPLFVTYLPKASHKHKLKAIALRPNVIEKLGKLTPAFLIDAVRTNPAILELNVKNNVIKALIGADYEKLLAVVYENPCILAYLPAQLQTSELCTLAIEASAHTYQYLATPAYA